MIFNIFFKQYTVVCKTSGTGFCAFYTPKRQTILLKIFNNYKVKLRLNIIVDGL